MFACLFVVVFCVFMPESVFVFVCGNDCVCCCDCACVSLFVLVVVCLCSCLCPYLGV